MQLRSAFKHQKAEVFATASMASVWGQSDEFQLDYYQNHAFLGFQLQPQRGFLPSLCISILGLLIMV
ncbi:hypothetical protein JCM19231_5612 [Vibrio ishigakensis]|uniref:Uncharacterized protein n=1 Tax=Vibrio ishigakensis TaxID=1481914 RepID=A0A0B8NX69_9VIBR|nr:hypothetical protein JCM19231_5612 [Vibrio ishigakensis]